jgi:hypothetical protein
MMALSELAALDAAYQVLRPLDPDGRRRALQWLSDALAAEASLTLDAADTETPSAAATNPGMKPTPPASRRGSPATRAARRPRQPRPTRRTAAAIADAVTVAAGSTRTRGSRTASAAANDPAKRAKGATRRGARPYRRMPPADEVMAAYRRVGNVSGLASHFGVPGHTVQGWARQLRRHGYAIGQTR